MFSMPRIHLVIPAVVSAMVALALALPAVASADFPLTITEAGSGSGTVECDVEGGGAEPCEDEYAEGTELSLVPEADPGSEFVEFFGDCGPQECELTMDEGREVTVVFDEEEPEMFPLVVETVGSGSGTVECDVEGGGAEPCDEEYVEGTELSLVAEADPGSEFIEWLGDCGPEECELTMDAEHEVIAFFELDEGFALEIDINGPGAVECEVNGEAPEPCEAKYPEETEVTLIPVADENAEFVEFSGDCGPTECENLVMDEDHAVTVVFELKPGTEFELTITKAGTGDGEVECEVDGGEAESCEEEYEAGTELSLVATPDSESVFAGYSAGGGSAGGCSGLTCDFTITADSSVTATFNEKAGPEEFTLTITKAGAGGGVVKCKVNGGSAETCAAKYVTGTQLSLVAEPDSESTFAGYSAGGGSAGSCTSGLTCDFTITADSSVTATFNEKAGPEEFTLTITKAGAGGGVVKCKVNGGSAETCAAKYVTGTQLSLVAEPDSESTFAGYSAGGGSAGSCTSGLTCDFTITADSSVTATFNEKAGPEEFTLTITKAGAGGGVVKCKVNGGSAETCAAKYVTGTQLSLVAEPDSESTFAGYSAGGGSAGSCTSGLTCEFTITANSSVTATFNKKPAEFTLTITKAGAGGGVVKCKVNGGSAETCAAKYVTGTQLSLVAEPDSESTFAGYSAGGGSAGSCTSGLTCEFTITANSSVTATFNKKAPPAEFSLTVSKAGSGSGTVTCNGGACAATYPEGTVVTLAASAASGSTFAGWSGGGCSGTGTCVVTINANTTVTATFSANPTPEPEKPGTAKVGGSASVSSGKAMLKLTCSGGACKGTLKLTAKVKQGNKTKKLVIGKASFSLADGASTTLKVKLSGPAKQELAKGKTLKASVSGTGVASSKVKLKAKKKK